MSFFYNDTATTEIYTLSLHDALPISPSPDFAGKRLVMHVRDCSPNEVRIPFHVGEDRSRTWIVTRTAAGLRLKHDHRDRKSTRLNSSHANISYAVFCLKKENLYLTTK